ncbi:MAG: fused MFS/spermidine synthase, partial [Planctomycetota bacterium]
RFFIKIDLAIICFSIVLPFIFHAVHAYLFSPGVFFFFKMLFLVISFISGFLTGSQFPLANMLYLRYRRSLSDTAGLLYAFDLLGGWFGGIVGAVVLLPVLGLTGTCITVGLLKLTSFIVLTSQSNQHLLGGKK